MKVLISGASGLIGNALSRELSTQGHSVRKLVRRRPGRSDEVQWDPASGLLDPALMDDADAVINLSGAGIGDRPWTRSYVEELYSSRLRPTRTLVAAMQQADRPPEVFLSQSASGYYGDRGDEVLTEEAGSGDLLISDICRRWEAEALQAPATTRTILMRTGVVFSPRGGALGRLLPPLRLGLGGPLGSGRQWWPWLSLPDTAGAAAFLLTSDRSGPVNLSAPEPARLSDITTALGEAYHRPSRLRVPGPVLSAALGRLARELVLASARVRPAALEDAGYRFRHPDLPSVARWLAAGGDGPAR